MCHPVLCLPLLLTFASMLYHMLPKLNQKRLLCSDPTECVSAVLKSGWPCIAATRSGSFQFDDVNSTSVLTRSNSLLSEARAVVAKLDSLFTIVDKIADKDKDSIGAIIFAASSSTKGKNPGVYDACTVDYQGVINSAQFCIQYNISRFIMVSSGVATWPNSLVYKLLNFVGGGIMEAKIQGDDGVRKLYKIRRSESKG